MTTKTEPTLPRCGTDYIATRTSGPRAKDQSRLGSYQILSKSCRYQFVVCRPCFRRNILFNLKAHRRIQLNPLQITKHDPDYVGQRQRAVTVALEIFFERSLWRRDDYIFLRPDLAKRCVATAFHIGLLDDNE